VNPNRIVIGLLAVLITVVLAAPGRCAAASDTSKPTGGSARRNPPLPKPTLANMPYGSHERQVLDTPQDYLIATLKGKRE